MKKIYTLFSIIALATLTVACQKEISAEQDILAEETVSEDGTLTVVLSVPDSQDSKTVMGTKSGSSYPVRWSAGDGDYLSLNGTVAYASNKDSDTQYSASFKPSVGLSVYNFLYRGDAGHDNQVSFPSTQNYVADGFDPASMPMYAASASRSESVTFSHLGALLRFSFTGEKKIDAVTLTAADASKSLSGTFTIGKTAAGLLNGSLTPTSGGASLAYSFGSHKQLSDTPFIFYIAIPAGTYEGGITLDIVDNDSGHMTVTVMNSNSSKTIAAGKVREFDNVVYVPNKEVNLKQIYNDATFLEFVSAVAGGNKTLNARLTQNAATLSLSAATVSAFESIDDYAGTFDGNNKGIAGLTKPMFNTLKGVVKNLTLNSTIVETDAGNTRLGMFAREVEPSSQVDDIAGLQNCTANGSVSFEPSTALADDDHPRIGGMVGNNKGGTFVNCTNNANVTFGGSETHNVQPSIGGVVGRTQKGGDLSTQGDISNCTNNGTVICSADFGQGVYIGGVLGYQVEKAESISGCSNSGLVKVTSDFSTTAALHLGGVIGMGKGTIESCSNLSGGVVTSEEGSTAGSYICQGGVVGRLNREKDSYSGLTNAGDVNVAAAGASTGAYIGGIAGRCNEGASISDCTNTGGTIEFSGDISTCELHIGGIVGNTNKPVSNCINGTAIIAGGTYSLNTSGKYYSVGGIVGYQKSDEALTDNFNTAAVTFTGTVTGYTSTAGICGYANGPIIGGGNSGTITFAGSSNSQNCPFGGIAARTPSGKSGARIDGVTNSGAIVINTSTQSSKYVFAGGIVGDHQSGDLNATNSGTITVNELKCTQFMLGGLVGQNKGEITSGSANLASGDITVSGLTSSQQSYIGGIAGTTNQPVSANNAGDIVTTSGSKVSRSYYVGGIIGRADGALTSCTNSGLISNAAPMSGGGDYWMEIGGIVGYNTGNSPITDCHNTGDVINSGNSGAYLMVGGITGESDGSVSNCDNTGDVTNSGNSGNSHPINVGGIAGRSSAGMTYCSNGTSTLDGGTISNSGTSAERLCVGGVYGYSNVNGNLSHSFNKGAVTNSGNTSGSAAFIGGAIGFQHNDSSDAESSSYNQGIASVITYVDNTGAVTNDSVMSGDLQLGGIAAEVWGSVDHCTNAGPVTVASNINKALYMGGILGWWETNTSNSVTYCENLATGEVTVNPGTNIENQFWVSGVVGGERGDIEATNSHLINRARVTLGEDSSEGAITSGTIKNTTYSYLSGIGGGSGSSYVAYEYCENYGKILFRGTMHRVRVGGVVACAFRSPDHSKCIADIRSYKSRGGNYKDDVGGVIGYYKAESDNTINDILYKGYINTQSTSPRCYTAGLVGRVNNDALTFTDCKLGGQIRGVGTSPYNTVAFVCCAVAEHEINITNLIVETGTKRTSTAVSSLSLNYNSVGGSVGVLCFGTPLRLIPQTLIPLLQVR